MSDARTDAIAAQFRTAGFALRLGLRVKPASLPRSRRARRHLEQHAQHDIHVRRALDHAKRAAAKPTLLDRLRPQDEVQIW